MNDFDPTPPVFLHDRELAALGLTDTATDAPKLKDCLVCDGTGYQHCDCWPCDCICGFGDELCDECGGHGFIDPDDDYGYDEGFQP